MLTMSESLKGFEMAELADMILEIGEALCDAYDAGDETEISRLRSEYYDVLAEINRRRSLPPLD